MLYDNAQAVARKRVSAWHGRSTGWTSRPGGVALDVGSGPGNVTASLARAAGPDGLALGVDISEPMLARAVSARRGRMSGFLAGRRRNSFHCGTRPSMRGYSLAVLQLIPDPPATLAEIVRVLRPGGRVAIMVPTAGRGGALLRWLPNGGAHFFAEDELGDTFEDLGLVGVRTKTLGNIQWVRGTARNDLHRRFDA